jgi:hypothetical protein
MRKSFEIKKGPKQSCRELLCHHASNLPTTPKRIFTLPGKEILCVKTFKKHFPKAQITGIERDPAIFEIICDKGVSCLNANIRQYVYSNNIPTNHFDVVFLDYYSYLNEDVIQDIKAFLANRNIIHKGKPFVLGITLLKAIRGQVEEANQFMRNNIYNGHKQEVANTVQYVGDSLKNFISSEFLGLKSIKLVEAHDYKAIKTSSPMYFFCFTIEI